MNGDLEMPFCGGKRAFGNASPPGDPIPGLRERSAASRQLLCGERHACREQQAVVQSEQGLRVNPQSTPTSPTGFSRFPPEVAGGFSPRRKADAGPFSGGAYFPANEKQTPSLPAVENAGANKHSLSNGRVASRHGIAGTREVLATSLLSGIKSPGCEKKAAASRRLLCGERHACREQQAVVQS